MREKGGRLCLKFSFLMFFLSPHKQSILISGLSASCKQNRKHKSSGSLDFQNVVVTTTSVTTPSVTSVLTLPIVSFKLCVSHFPLLAGLSDEVSEPKHRRKREGGLHSLGIPASNQESVGILTEFLTNCSCQSLELWLWQDGAEFYSVCQRPLCIPNGNHCWSAPTAVTHGHV